MIRPRWSSRRESRGEGQGPRMVRRSAVAAGERSATAPSPAGPSGPPQLGTHRTNGPHLRVVRAARTVAAHRKLVRRTGENGKAGQRQEVAPRLSVVVWRPPREGTRRAAGLGRSLGSPAQGRPGRRRDIGGRAVACRWNRTGSIQKKKRRGAHLGMQSAVACLNATRSPPGT